MSRHTRYELRRKCAKCNITAAEDRNLSFHRFPQPGRHTIIKARVWAEYCYPTGEWSTEKSLRDLHSQHKMLCSKHFDNSSFTSSARIRLNNYAIPIGTQDLLGKFRQKQCASGTEQDTNISVEKPQALVTTETTLPVQVPVIANPTISLPAQVPTICEPTADSLKLKMAENYNKMCRVCLTKNMEDNISDSSCYTKFFIQVTDFKKFNEILWLCMWCKAALRRAMAFFTLALESEKCLQNKIPTDISTKPKSLQSLSFVYNEHIYIPPLSIEFQDLKTENITEEFEEPTNPLRETEDDGILIKRKRTTLTHLNEESVLNKEDELTENEIETEKRKNKKEFDFSELKFEVEYLNLEEQLKEVELKKLKYQDFKFQCDDCGLGFLTNDVFEEHKVRHSELSGPHKCNICALHFKSQDVLSQHMLAHKRRFNCLLCSSRFTRWSHCVAHRYKCGGAVDHIACGDCAKIFSNEYSLKIHRKVHTAEKKYCCDQCNMKLISKQRLTVHMRSHTGSKPFSCPQCARNFTTRSNLRAHSAVHEHTTQFYCVECHTYYKTAKSLKRHFKESSKHVGLKNDMYTCHQCSSVFSSEKTLNYHIGTRHGTDYRCTHCDKTFSNNSNLNKHIKCIHIAK